MVNYAAVGRTGTPFELDVERGKIREFAAATRSSNPAYWKDEHPVAPPTFLATQAFWQPWAGVEADPWPSVELNQQRGMHAEQEYVFHGPPPRAGSRLTGQSRIAEIYDKQGRRGGTLTFAVMVTEFRDESGRLVAEARLTGVESSQVPDRGAAATAPAEPLPSDREPLRVGPLTRTDFVRYQGASGDMNPLHHDETFARAAGYDAPLAIGMLNAGLLGTYATDWLGAENVRRFRIRFKEQVWPGDTLRCTGTIAREYEHEGEPLVDVELACAREAGGVAVQVWAAFAR